MRNYYIPIGEEDKQILRDLQYKMLIAEERSELAKKLKYQKDVLDALEEFTKARFALQDKVFAMARGFLETNGVIVNWDEEGAFATLIIRTDDPKGVDYQGDTEDDSISFT